MNMQGGPNSIGGALTSARNSVERQKFSRRAMLAGGAALLATPLLNACSTGPSGPATNEASAATGTARRGGTLTIARPPSSSAETLDPAGSLSAYEYMGALYSRLVKQAPDGTPAPDLATKWETTPDAKTWTITLRDGVTFHNGKPFTSADAAYTIRHILDPKTESPQAGVLSPLLTASGITTPDKNTLVCSLTAPNAEFMTLLMNYSCYVVPDGSAATIGATGIGTGPFSLVSYEAGAKGVLKVNPDYYAGRANLDQIVFTTIADERSRINALLSKQADLVSQTPLDYATQLQVRGTSGCTTARVKNAQWSVLPMLCTAAPFTDVAVRQAFKLAYDPTEIMNLAVRGAGTVANNNPVPPTDAYYLDYKVTPDPDKAKSILQKAGLLNRPQQLFTSSVDPVLTPLCEAYQSSVKKAGLNIEISTAAADSYFTTVWTKKPFCASYWYTGRPTDQLLNQIFRAGSSYNESKWDDSTFTSILDAARATTDDAKRKQHYQDAQKLLIDNDGTIIPFFADRVTGLSDKVVNYSEYGFEFDYVKLGFAA